MKHGISSLLLSRCGVAVFCWLGLLATPVAADETFILIPTPKPEAKPLDTLVPNAGPPAIPDPDPMAITPLVPMENPAADAATEETAPIEEATPEPSSPANLEEVAKDLPALPSDIPPALTPVPAKKPAISIATENDTPQQSVPSEPLPMISKESRDILAKIPSGIDAQKPADKMKIDVSHAKDTSYVSATGEPPADNGTATSNAMGMSIQIKNSPLNFDYELEKAYNAIVAGHTEVAIEIYQRILANDPVNRSALFGLASSYHRAGQIDLARPLYGKLLSLDPNNRDALNNFMVLLADEAPQEALDQMAVLEDKNPGYSVIPAQMAVVYLKLGQVDKASDKMFKAASLAPENLTYRYNLAIMLDKQEKYDEAAKLYKQLLEASSRGEMIPGNKQKIQERLTFISSNRP